MTAEGHGGPPGRSTDDGFGCALAGYLWPSRFAREGGVLSTLLQATRRIFIFLLFSINSRPQNVVLGLSNALNSILLAFLPILRCFVEYLNFRVPHFSNSFQMF